MGKGRSSKAVTRCACPAGLAWSELSRLENGHSAWEFLGWGDKWSKSNFSPLRSGLTVRPPQER
jgi:hypothetical protein